MSNELRPIVHLQVGGRWVQVEQLFDLSITPAVRKVVTRTFDHAGAQGDEQCGVAARLSTLTSERG
jgi:hypothetical protein